MYRGVVDRDTECLPHDLFILRDDQSLEQVRNQVTKIASNWKILV